MIRLTNVTKHYRRGDEQVVGVESLTLSVMEGEFVALVGPSGCGKSTTLNLLAGAERADQGSVIVDGLELKTADERRLTQFRRESIGVVFQDFFLIPNLTVAENVALPLALAGIRHTYQQRVPELVAEVGLSHRIEHTPDQLSGGEQQRVAIARALIHQPKVLLADEPTGNLDRATSRSIMDLLEKLRRQHGSTLVVATHDEQVAAAADTIVHLSDGRIANEIS